MNNEIIEKLAKLVSKKGGKTYYVGGYVRDLLLSKESKDIDIEVHGIQEDTLKEILKKVGKPLEYGKEFGIYSLAGTNIDIALPRSEVKTGEGHRDFEVKVDPFISIEDAAKRRDFTINSMMIDVLTNELIDPFNGKEDLEKRIIKQQKSLSRKYHLSKEINKKFIKSHNYMKNKYRLHKLRSKLQSIRESYLNDTINKIVFIKNNTIPYRIVIEDLNVKEMLNTADEVKKKENKHLRPLIQKVAFSKILTKIKEKCLFYDIKLVVANQYFPSSKTCSCCHYIKNNLKLSDRIYMCDNCGLIIKRDLNAAINLARY